MTVQTEQTDVAPTPEPEVGLVLGTGKRIFSVMESRVPEEWLERITAASEPVLVDLDQRLAKTVTEVNERVISPLSDAVNTRVIKPVTSQIVVPVTTAVTTNVIEPVTTRVVEPVTKKVGEWKETDIRGEMTKKVGEWKDIRGEMTKKALERLEKGFQDVKEFSATRGKEMVHVDLIEYSREVLDNAQAIAVPYITKAMESVNELQEFVAAQASQAQEQVHAVSELLTAKYAKAKEAARDLSAQGIALVQAKYVEATKHLPEQEWLEAKVDQLPARLQKSVLFILKSPQLFSEVTARADLDTSKRTIDNINNLVNAVREVVFASETTVAATEPVAEAATEASE